jgi:metallo-beta-lactamase family protein
MKVQLLGAAQTVTGSCYIIEANNSRLAIDCGMHQGNAEIEKRNYAASVYNAAKLDCILLTHAHMDHSGLLPRMVKEKYSGSVYCTEPTRDLLGIMLLDSAHIQEMEAEWFNRKRARQGGKPILPLYSSEDAEAAAKLLRGIGYNQTFEPVPGIRVTYRDAGHILGSAFLEVEVAETDGVTNLIFSGDLGRPNALLMDNPDSPLLRAKYLFLESTYGDRNHKNENTSRDELAAAIEYSYNHGEKTIIPAFAVERTQEIVYTLFLLHKEGRLPDLPIFVDSPLAIRATGIFRQHPTYFDRSTIALIETGEDPFSLPSLRYTIETKESQAINSLKGPAIVISASGMCNAGRIKHHLRHNLWRTGASIVFTGYQAVGTPGRKIVDGAKSISILGEEVAVAAKVFTIGGFSGHAGQSQILDWVAAFARNDLNIFLTHGEEKAQNILAGLLRERFGMKVTIPSYLEELILSPGKDMLVQFDTAHTPQKINWDVLFADTEAKVLQLKTAAAGMANRQWAEQTELRDKILEINSRMLHILSQT